jgi:hypothetical protein
MEDGIIKPNYKLLRFLWHLGVPTKFENIIRNTDGTYKISKEFTKAIDVGFPQEVKNSMADSIHTQINSHLSEMKYEKGIDIDSYFIYDAHKTKNEIVKFQPLLRIKEEDSALVDMVESAGIVPNK